MNSHKECDQPNIPPITRQLLDQNGQSDNTLYIASEYTSDKTKIIGISAQSTGEVHT